jgi:hypothetical protein
MRLLLVIVISISIPTFANESVFTEALDYYSSHLNLFSEFVDSVIKEDAEVVSGFLRYPNNQIFESTNENALLKKFIVEWKKNFDAFNIAKNTTFSLNSHGDLFFTVRLFEFEDEDFENLKSFSESRKKISGNNSQSLTWKKNNSVRKINIVFRKDDKGWFFYSGSASYSKKVKR